MTSPENADGAGAESPASFVLPVGVSATVRSVVWDKCWADIAQSRISMNPACNDVVVDEELRLCQKHLDEIFGPGLVVPEEVVSAA